MQADLPEWHSYYQGLLDLLHLFNISTGILLLLLNIPVTILAWRKVGKSFTFYSFLSVILMSFFMEIIPITRWSPDILLNAVFGGVIAAVGVGITLKFGASTGGMDIIAMLLSRKKDKPVGTYLFLLNGVIIVTAGAVYGPEKALYTLVTLYTSTRVVDAIHTRHEKLTAMIITKKSEELKQAIHAKLVRGITRVPAKGAFTNESKEMLLIVITRYELYDLEKNHQGSGSTCIHKHHRNVRNCWYFPQGMILMKNQGHYTSITKEGISV